MHFLGSGDFLKIPVIGMASSFLGSNSYFPARPNNSLKSELMVSHPPILRIGFSVLPKSCAAENYHAPTGGQLDSRLQMMLKVKVIPKTEKHRLLGETF